MRFWYLGCGNFSDVVFFCCGSIQYQRGSSCMNQFYAVDRFTYRSTKLIIHTKPFASSNSGPENISAIWQFHFHSELDFMLRGWGMVIWNGIHAHNIMIHFPLYRILTIVDLLDLRNLDACRGRKWEKYVCVMCQELYAQRSLTQLLVTYMCIAID